MTGRELIVRFAHALNALRAATSVTRLASTRRILFLLMGLESQESYRLHIPEPIGQLVVVLDEVTKGEILATVMDMLPLLSKGDVPQYTLRPHDGPIAPTVVIANASGVLLDRSGRGVRCAVYAAGRLLAEMQAMIGEYPKALSQFGRDSEGPTSSTEGLGSGDLTAETNFRQCIADV